MNSLSFISHIPSGSVLLVLFSKMHPKYNDGFSPSPPSPGWSEPISSFTHIFATAFVIGLPASALTLSQSIFTRAARGNLLICKSDHFSYLLKTFQIIYFSLGIKAQIIRMVCKAVKIWFYPPPIHLCFHLYSKSTATIHAFLLFLAKAFATTILSA